MEWEDSAFLQGWMPKEEAKAHSVSNCVSTGILLDDGKGKVTIVQSVSDKDHVGDGLTIPKSCIKRIRILKVKGIRR